MKEIFINGRFLCQRITGVQRFAFEIVKRLDELPHEDISFKIIAPSKEYTVNHFDFKNIPVIHVKGKPGYFWEQITLARYCKKHKPYDLLNLCNVAPVLYPGSCVIHDLGCIDAKKGFSFKQILVYRFINRCNVKKYKNIFTVSEFIKKRIEEYYKVKNINVIYNGHEHFNCPNASKPEFDLPDKYYFAVGSMNPNKNFESILRLAKNNKKDTFYVTGGTAKNFKKMDLEIPENVKFTGYLEDSELAYLYMHCYAFLFSSLYEGFGIPPLEALVLGCKNIICNEIDVLKEIYGNYAVFTDFSKNIDLAELPLKQDIDLCELKRKYSWEKSAGKLIELYSE